MESTTIINSPVKELLYLYDNNLFESRHKVFLSSIAEHIILKKQISPFQMRTITPIIKGNTYHNRLKTMGEYDINNVINKCLIE